MRLSTLALCSALLSGAAFAEKQPDTSHLPAAVQQRIKEYNAEGDLKKIKTHKQKDGSTVYEVEYKERGNTEMLVLAEDGSVISESSGKGKSKAKGKGQAKKEEKKGKGKGERIANESDDHAKTPAPVAAPVPPVTTPSTSKSADATANVPPTPAQATTPAATSPTVSSPSGTAATTTTPPKPAARPTTRPMSPAVRPVAIDRLPGETRYAYWDNVPATVRTAALAQQAEQGAANAKLVRVQKKGAKTIFHIPYEKATVSFNEDGSVAVPAAENGGPMRTTTWDELPEPVRKAALAAQSTNGDANARVITYQSNGGKSLYHILYAKELVQSYSQDGKLQDPATYWK
jgi:hypothetical protein